MNAEQKQGPLVIIGGAKDKQGDCTVSGDEFTVVGQGSVTVVDETTSTHNNLEGLLKDEPIALCGVQLHILPHGYRFDLKKRVPLL